jgi:hypothetical protein
MIKAECLLRLEQNEEEVARLFFEIRNRVFNDIGLARVTVDDLKADTRIKYGTLDWDNNLENLGDMMKK